MYILIFLFTLALLGIAEGTGAWAKRMLGIDRTGYHAPVGFAFLLAVMQLLFYPAEIMGLSFRWIIVGSCLVLAAGLVFLFFDLPDVKKSLFRWETLIVLLTASMFIFLTMRGEGVLGNSMEQEFSSKLLSELQTPKYQGYYHFALCFAWLCDLPHRLIPSVPLVNISAAEIYGLGLFYVMVSTMLIVNVVRGFRLKNHWFEFSLFAYLLLNGNYTAWTQNTAWLGTSWLILFTALAIMVCHSYLRLENEQIKYLLIPVFGAGLACDNGFGLCAIAVLYGFMAYLFSIRKIRSLFDFFTFLIPLMLYIVVKSSEHWWWPLSWVLFLLYLWFSFRRYVRPLRRWIARAEEYFFDHYREIMFFGVPGVMVVFSVILVLLKKDSSLISYTYYFQDFTEVDGMRDYIFLHSDIVEIILNLFRWGGVVSLFLLAEEKQDSMVRTILLCTLILFVNPLCTPGISYFTGPMFAHTFSVLFNPCTEAIMFLYVYRMFQWTVIGQWVLEITLCSAALITLAGIVL